MAPEEEKHAADLEAATPPLKHFQNISQHELDALQQTYQRSLPQLEKIIDENKKIFRYYKFNYFVANYGSCALFLIFPIITSNQGIETFVQIFSPETSVSDAVGYSIGAPLSCIETILYMILFSVRKEAIKATLSVATQKSLWRQLEDAKNFFRHEPLNVFKHLSNHFGHEGMLLVCNLTGTTSELIFIPIDYSKPLPIIFALITLFYGNEYGKKYTNPNYYEGLDFFFKEEHPGLEALFEDRDFTTILQIALQSTSSIGLRVFPLFYYFAVAAEQTLGIWPHPYLVSALTAIQSIFIYYPATFHHYMDDYERLKKFAVTHPDTLPDLAEFRKEFFREKAYTYIFKKERMTALLILTRSILGGYFGYTMASNVFSLLINKTLAQVLFLPAGALAFGALLYDAEIKRFLRKELASKFSPEPENPVAAAPLETYTISHSFGVFFNVVGSFVGAMSTVGTLQPLIGNDLPEVTTIITLLAFERMLNNIYFNQDKVEDSVKDLSNYIGSFFNRPKTPVIQEQNPGAAPRACFFWRR